MLQNFFQYQLWSIVIFILHISLKFEYCWPLTLNFDYWYLSLKLIKFTILIIKRFVSFAFVFCISKFLIFQHFNIQEKCLNNCILLLFFISSQTFFLWYFYEIWWNKTFSLTYSYKIFHGTFILIIIIV